MITKRMLSGGGMLNSPCYCDIYDPDTRKTKTQLCFSKGLDSPCMKDVKETAEKAGIL